MKTLLKRLVPETHPLRLFWHRSKAFGAALRFGFPARSLIVVGITGTDGKTTTCGMVAHILNANGKKCGALSTAFFQVGTKTEWNPTQKTSPSPFVVQKFLRRCVDEGCTHVVLECSSHGLLQGRLSFTWPTVAAITNLSEEHLDYHGTMDAYLDAKKILFTMLRRSVGVAVLNADDRSYPVLHHVPALWHIDYSMKKEASAPDNDHECALWTTDDAVETGAVKAALHYNAETKTWNLSIPIAGRFNLQNALCAIGCAHGIFVDVSDAVAALSTFTGVAGRMEPIDAGQSFSVFIDFTVTPQSYNATLSTLRSGLAPGKRLLVLLGSCGDRMKEKRPVVGGIAARLADIMIVTNEDPYTEDPEKIIDDVLSGVPKTTPIYEETVPSNAPAKYCLRVSDRGIAIRTILRLAKSGDAVILCGKGSDTTMMVRHGQIPWNEREIAREELKKLASAYTTEQ